MKDRTGPTGGRGQPQSAFVGRGVSLLDLIDSLPFYAMLVDSSHHILMANEAVRRHLDVEPEDIVGKYCPKVVHGLDGPFPGCPLEEAAEKGRAVEYEVLDEGTGRWLRSAIYPTTGATSGGKQVFFHMVTDITDRKQAEERLRISQEQLRSMSLHLESAREEEKKRLARSMHDETSQVVSSLTAYLEAALYKLPASATETRAMLEKSRDLAGRILDDLHTLIYELHPLLLRDLGLVAAVGSLINDSLEPIGVKAGLQTRGKTRRLPPDLEMVLFRVIQEAVSNIARHANARNARIVVYFKKDKVSVSVADDGRGFDVAEALSSVRGLRGFGLLSVKERIELVDGTFNIKSQPGKGTVISFEVPMHGAQMPHRQDPNHGHNQMVAE